MLDRGSGSKASPVGGMLIALLALCVVGGLAVALLAGDRPPSANTPLAFATSTTIDGASAPLNGGDPNAPDPFEPDDDMASAALITTDGRPQEHKLHREGDLDYVYFQAREGRAYTIQTLDLGEEIDTVIYLYDAQGRELLCNDDGSQEPRASRLVWVAPASGPYYLLIRDLGDQSFGSNARYSVSVTESAEAEGADALEPDDDFASARAMAVNGAPQTRTFHTSTDEDLVYLVAQEGLKYLIETAALQGGCDTVLFLYDEEGTELAYDDDAGQEPLSSRLEWIAESSGTCYVKVRDFHGRAGPEVSYRLSIVSE